MALEESTTNSESTSTGDGLGDGDSALVQRSRVSAVCEGSGGLGEVGNTGDASVLLVEVLLNNSLLGLLNRRQDVRLTLVVTVSADT